MVDAKNDLIFNLKVKIAEIEEKIASLESIMPVVKAASLVRSTRAHFITIEELTAEVSKLAVERVELTRSVNIAMKIDT